MSQDPFNPGTGAGVLAYRVAAVAEALGCSGAVDSLSEAVRQVRRERDEAVKELAHAREQLTRVHAERVAADRRNVGLRRDLAKLLAEHGGVP